MLGVISVIQFNNTMPCGARAHGPRTCPTQVVYKRYASLFFIAVVDLADNELITLEVRWRAL